ncbi:hypothetical protein B0J14DRAFT_188391 [Halenospora varia]|nr:hypothetical protein B0J14DRAFT_188391 [Halenospora varia]
MHSIIAYLMIIICIISTTLNIFCSSVVHQNLGSCISNTFLAFSTALLSFKSLLLLRKRSQYSIKVFQLMCRSRQVASCAGLTWKLVSMATKQENECMSDEIPLLFFHFLDSSEITCIF